MNRTEQNMDEYSLMVKIIHTGSWLSLKTKASYPHSAPKSSIWDGGHFKIFSVLIIKVFIKHKTLFMETIVSSYTCVRAHTHTHTHKHSDYTKPNWHSLQSYNYFFYQIKPLTWVVALTEELQEAEKLAGELCVMHVLLPGTAPSFTGHPKTLRFLGPLKCIQVKNTAATFNARMNQGTTSQPTNQINQCRNMSVNGVQVKNTACSLI